MKLALESGANVDWQNANECNQTLLMSLAENGKIDGVRVLVDAGANLDYTVNRSGGTGTALALACQNIDAGKLEIIELLISRGADVNITDECDQTALHNAVSDKSVAAVKALLSANIDLGAKDEEGMTALDIAVNDGSDEIVDLLQAAMG